MLTKGLKANFISGFLVFLIALPLCLGISKASGFPPIAGIYTAIIGGLVVTFMSNASMAIKGPAAGLIAIAVAAVEELGQGDQILGYKLTLAVVVVSGVFQIILGLAKAGKLGGIFPISVIHGMLAAIGIIIISKQIHIVFGVVPEAKNPLALLAEVPNSVMNANPEVTLIGLFSLAVLFIHPIIKNDTIKKVPAPLIVLCAAIPFGLFFDLSIPHDYEIGSLNYHIDPAQLLVALPDQLWSTDSLPDFSQITSMTSIKYVIMFALVGSIESILSATAVDSLDPKSRKTNQNQDLLAVGIGNTFAGFIGGLPMITEIVRSSANINNGAKGKMSNFFHGLFLLLFVVLAAPIIKSIPNAALAAMLVFTGFKLANPHEFKRMALIGMDQLVLFLTTLVVTLATDLLMGVIVGILLKIFIEIISGVSFKELFKLKTDISQTEDGVLVKVSGIASFLNYLKFKSKLDSQTEVGKVTLDFSEAKFIDHTFLSNINQLQNEFSKDGKDLRKVGFEKHNFQSNHPLASRRFAINPTLSDSHKELSKREIAFGELAEKYNLDYEKSLSSSFIRPYLSPFDIVTRMRNATHFLIGHEENFNYIIFDLRFNNLGDFFSEVTSSTVAIMYNIARGGVPDFYTDKDSSIFNRVERYDFTKMKKSKTVPFTVYGSDEQLINEFFNADLSKMIDSNPYELECQRRVVMVHKEWEKISEGRQMESFVKYIKDLGNEIMKNK